MNYLWCVGQAGILLEVGGAFWLVLSAWKGAREQAESPVSKMTEPFGDVRRLEMPTDATIQALGSISREFNANAENKFKNELYGFTALGVGLILQFVGNLNGWNLT